MSTQEPEVPPPEFLCRVARQIHNALRKTIRNPDDRDDIIHDTFAKAIPRGLLAEGRTATLISIAIFTAIDLNRSSRRRRRILQTLGEAGQFPESIEPEPADHRLDRDDLILRVMEAMGQLPDDTRRCIEDHFLKGKTIRQMAEEMDIVGRNVERRLATALRLLRGLLAASRPFGESAPGVDALERY